MATTYNPPGNDAVRLSAAGEPEPPFLPSLLVRLTAILLATILAAPGAFSADPPRETTSRSGLTLSHEIFPLRQAPDATATPLSPQAPVAAEPLPHLALILPLSSPILGQVAEALRQGFLAGAEVAGRDALPIRVYSAVDDGAAALELCRRAQADGAVLVIAGLTRDGATRLARSECPRQLTLLLNQPQDTPLAEGMYAISLSADQEARQAAAMALNDGKAAAIVIASPSPLAHRVAEAFAIEWGRGAREVRRLAFSGEPQEAPAVKAALAALKGDMVFIALDQSATRALRPYIPATLPVYATSLSVNPRAEPNVNVDLEGVRYVDMPWFVQPDHPAVMVYPPPKAVMSIERERLYALGIDVYRLCGALLGSDARSLTLDGVTGRIDLEPDRYFSRTLVPTGFEAGRAVPLPSRQ